MRRPDQRTRVFVDFNGGGTDMVDLNGDGNTTDINVDGINETTSDLGMIVTELQSVRLYDIVDKNRATAHASGHRTLVTPPRSAVISPWPGVRIRQTASLSVPGFDVGTTVPPQYSFTVNKTVALQNDADNDGYITPGDTLTYTIEVKNTSPYLRDHRSDHGLGHASGERHLCAQQHSAENDRRLQRRGRQRGWHGFPPGYRRHCAESGRRPDLPANGTWYVTFRVTIPANDNLCGSTLTNEGYGKLGLILRSARVDTLLTCPGKLTIVKVANGSPGTTFDYTTVADPLDPALPGNVASFTITPPANGSAQVQFNLVPRTYTVTEAAETGWTLQSVSCNNNGTGSVGNRQAVITLPQNGDVTCTFTNARPQVRIQITPGTATNAVGISHTFTVTLQGTVDGTNWTPITNTVINESIANSLGANGTITGGTL